VTERRCGQVPQWVLASDITLTGHVRTWAEHDAAIDQGALGISAARAPGVWYSAQSGRVDAMQQVELGVARSIFGTTFLPGSTSYLLGPNSATCQGALASADGGESMTATSVSDHPARVTMTISPGGAGPSADLACPYIPAVRAADEAFRRGDAFCAHPSAEVIRQSQIRTRMSPANLATVEDALSTFLAEQNIHR
jgi:hypothetical protein